MSHLYAYVQGGMPWSLTASIEAGTLACLILAVVFAVLGSRRDPE